MLLKGIELGGGQALSGPAGLWEHPLGGQVPQLRGRGGPLCRLLAGQGVQLVVGSTVISVGLSKDHVLELDLDLVLSFGYLVLSFGYLVQSVGDSVLPCASIRKVAREGGHTSMQLLPLSMQPWAR